MLHSNPTNHNFVWTKVNCVWCKPSCVSTHYEIRDVTMVMCVLIAFASLSSTKHFLMSGRVEHGPHKETQTKSGAHCFINEEDRVTSLSWWMHYRFSYASAGKERISWDFRLSYADVNSHLRYDLKLHIAQLSEHLSSTRWNWTITFSSECFSWDVTPYAMYKSNMKYGIWGFANSLTCECEACLEVGRATFELSLIEKRAN